MKLYTKTTIITLTVMSLLFAGCGAKNSDNSDNSNNAETPVIVENEQDNSIEENDDAGSNQDVSAMQTEQPAPTEQPVDPQSIIRELFNSNILPEYGLADIKQKGIIKYDSYSWEKLMKKSWLKPKGIVSAYIDDLDSDNESELMVVYIKGAKKDTYNPDYKSYDICADIYELSDNTMLCSDTIILTGIDNFSNSKLIVSVVKSQGKAYIIYEKSSSAVFADGIGQDYCALEYVDGKIYDAFAYRQTGGGSSDFEFTGYQYDKGKIIKEKLLYSEWYEKKGKFKTVQKGIEYLFGKYGIAINKKAFGNGEDGWSAGWVKGVYDATQISILKPGDTVVPVMEYSVRNYNKGYETGRYKFKAVGKDYTGLH